MKTTPESPLVTIAIPTYNRCGTLGAAIDSALAQAFDRFEVLVCDNASIDGTDALLAGYADPRLRVVRQPQNIGLVGNWNACLAQARGDLLLVLSDDDGLVPTALQDLTAAFGLAPGQGLQDADNSVAFAYGRCEVEFRDRGLLSLSAKAPPNEASLDYQIGMLLSTRLSYPSATLLRCADARECGGYDPLFAAAIDTGLLFRLANLRARVAFVARPTARYAMHADNFTSSIALPTLAATMAELAAVARTNAARSGTAPSSDVRKVLGRAPSKAIADMVCERQRQGTIGAPAALRMLWEQRAVFFSRPAWIVGAKAATKIMLRAWSRRTVGAIA